MKNYFIINPAAGKGGHCSALETNIIDYCSSSGILYEIYYTQHQGDAERYVRHHASIEVSECRFFACGGDGTLSEVINGAAGITNASVGVFPIGTGNDFVRNFTNSDRFMDIGSQLAGDICSLDLIKYNGRYSATTINFGFDAQVVETVANIKRHPAVPGHLAYIFGLIYQLIRKPGVSMRVSVDGGEPQERRLLLCCIGNSAFCGGGFNSCPQAELNDGILDICFIKNVSRTKFLSLVGAYKSGKFLAKKGIEKIVDYVRCSRLKVEFSEPTLASIDGELSRDNAFDISAERNMLKFSVPKGCVLMNDSSKDNAAEPLAVC